MAHSWESSFKEGVTTEARVAQIVTQYGFTVQSIGNLGNHQTPYTYSLDLSGKTKGYTAPDLTISKVGWPNIALEVKLKAMSGGYYWIDRRRLEYTQNWSRLTNNPVFWIIVPKHDPENIICASTRKLKDSYDSYNPHSKARNGNPEPTYLYKAETFQPLANLFAKNVKHEISYDLYSVKGDGELQLL